MGSIADVTYGEVGDEESITVGNVSIGFTEGKILVPSAQGVLEASKAEFKVEGDSIRFTRDGTTPTSTIGVLGEVGDIVTVEGKGNVKRFRAIRVTNDATINVDYSR